MATPGEINARNIVLGFLVWLGFFSLLYRQGAEKLAIVFNLLIALVFLVMLASMSSRRRHNVIYLFGGGFIASLMIFLVLFAAWS